jgi:chromosome segregation ATPase
MSTSTEEISTQKLLENLLKETDERGEVSNPEELENQPNTLSELKQKIEQQQSEVDKMKESQQNNTIKLEILDSIFGNPMSEEDNIILDLDDDISDLYNYISELDDNVNKNYNDILDLSKNVDTNFYDIKDLSKNVDKNFYDIKDLKDVSGRHETGINRLDENINKNINKNKY